MPPAGLPIEQVLRESAMGTSAPNAVTPCRGPWYIYIEASWVINKKKTFLVWSRLVSESSLV